ncbi:MAG: hypothetical protein ABR567_07840 [Myxococcales bacterium]
MKRVVAAVLAVSVALPAWAEEPPPPPPDEPQAAPMPSEFGYYEQCFGTPHPASGGRFGIGIYGEMPIPIGGSGGPTLPSVSGGKDDKVWLVVAVVAVAVLPVVVYAVDTPAPKVVMQRFRCPTFSMEILGGAENGRGWNGDGSYGMVSTRFGFSVGHVGTDFQYDATPDLIHAYNAHLVIRATPRAHVEGGLAIGYRRMVVNGFVEDGLELGLPHRYALWRDGLRTLSLDLRPMLLLGSRLEPSLEAAFLFPLADILQLRAGGRVYTFNGDLLWGMSAGMALTL